MPFGIGVTSPARCDPVLQAAVAYALGRDAVLIASSGNTSLFPGPDEPASCAGVLAVGGTEPDGTLWPGSAREPYVAVAAPADHMVYVGRDGRFTTTGAGTSFAAALAAGAAALIRSRYPHMPWYQVDQRLTGTATPAGHPVRDDGYGYGIVNLARAVNPTGSWPATGPGSRPPRAGPRPPATSWPVPARTPGPRPACRRRLAACGCACRSAR
jgi:subtilisin family serine protease